MLVLLYGPSPREGRWARTEIRIETQARHDVEECFPLDGIAIQIHLFAIVTVHVLALQSGAVGGAEVRTSFNLGQRSAP